MKIVPEVMLHNLYGKGYGTKIWGKIQLLQDILFEINTTLLAILIP
jgi:hypothetical protein